ncbi:MAG: NADH-quinone oxidoreductase subunit C [Pyrinomonadaceae bacterium]|nr:NADH-quinone oxidoreductase subunit C [Pyrinomonadaceae bacterium]
MSEENSLIRIADSLKTKNSAWILDVKDAFNEITLTVPRGFIVDVCWFLKTRNKFDMLADLCGADLGPEEEPRFEVNYHLFSTKTFERLRLKVLINEDDAHIQTVTGVWRTANWHERETFDMFGIVFDGHADLRRILLPSDFDGHALRKDYPLRGYEPYSLT